MVKVCDSIMGSGKSSAAIQYMNDRPKEKFIYITPYLSEAARIRKECASLRFVEPSNKLKEFGFSKSGHTAHLIATGRNITTTHQAFKFYTRDTIEQIRNQGYTLIIDESVDLLESFNFHIDDLRLAVAAGYVQENNGCYSLVDNDYHGLALREMMRFLKSRDLISVSSDSSVQMFYWTLPPELILAFKDVYILTYLFNGQSIKYFLDVNKIPYTRIGVESNGNKEYAFCDKDGLMPDYVYSLKERIHILDNAKLNDIGKNFHALSKSWFAGEEDAVQRLKLNIYNYFNNIYRDVPSEQKMWGTFKEDMSKIKGKGYTKAFVPFSIKATNQYRDRYCLAYASNVFMNITDKLFYQTLQIPIDEKTYALSILVQWIWRSAIRDGKPIDLYIPSRRMRTMLIDWIDTTSKGGVYVG